MSIFRSTFLSLCLLTAACADPSEVDGVPDLKASRQALTIENGGTLNGGTLNGGTLNGGTLNGGTLNGTNLGSMLVSVRRTGAKLNGSSLLDAIELQGSELTGRKGSTLYTGAAMVQTELVGNMGDGATIRLRVRTMQNAAAPNADVRQYLVEYRADNSSWYPVCQDAAGNPAWAVALSGRWDYRSGVPGGGAHIDDPSTFTLACAGGALAKCTFLGYRPWEAVAGTPLSPYHQSCTRLIRADYCGTGATYTQNGNRVNVYDTLNIQQDTENWVFEAEWDENGARCFYPLNRSSAGIPCYDDRVTAMCGQNVSATRGVRLVNETPTAGLTP